MALGLFLLALGVPSHALQDTAVDPPAEASTDVEPEPPAVAPEDSPAAEATDSAEEATPHPCRASDPESQKWLDRVQREVYETVCGSAFWFDSFFGDRRDYMERDDTHGRLTTSLDWDEHEGWEPKVRLKAKFNVPRFENRLRALVGRLDDEEFVTESQGDYQSLPETFEDTGEWLVGLGYNSYSTPRSRLDLSTGMKLRSPLDPYVSARYRRHLIFRDRNLISLRQTVFWRNALGVGLTSAAGFDRILSERLLVRGSARATWAEKTSGVEWRTYLTLFHSLSEGQALAYQIGFLGETDADVPVEEYGIGVALRRQFLRDWLFLEIRPKLGWRRDGGPDEPREAIPGITLSVDLFFGQSKP